MNNSLKRSFAATLMAGMMAASFGSHAAESATLTVKGILTPGSCGIELANNGMIDHGSMTPAQVKAEYKFIDADEGFYNITDQLEYTVHCDAATQVGLSIAADDEVNGSGYAAETSSTSLGKLPDGQTDIGMAYVIVNGQPTVDNAVAPLLMSVQYGSGWATINEGDSSIAGKYGQTPYLFTPGNENNPVAFQNWVGSLQVESWIKKTALDKITQETPYEGTFTLTLSYL